jgi:hypothetical protein
MRKSSFRLLPAPAQGGYREADKWVWCGSAVEEPGKGYHLYASRWRKDYPMLYGYVLFSEIIHTFSETLNGPYRFIEKLQPSGDPDKWNGMMAHNPTVIKYKGGYLMYYIASTYQGEATPADKIKEDTTLVFRCYDQIRIGLARSKSPAGPWEFLPEPVLEARPEKFDCTIVTNPAACVLPDGRIFLYYRSNIPGGGVNTGLAVAETPAGPYLRGDTPAIHDLAIEDPFVWHNGENLEMIAKDISGNLTGEKHAGAHFVSTDGSQWLFQGKAYSRTIKLDNGNSVTLGSLERPQLLFDAAGIPIALFAAAADGPGGFDYAENTWNQVIPLKFNGFVNLD